MTEILRVDDLDAAIELAAEKLDAGLPVGLPTDTVYVLAGDPTDPGVTDRLFQLKHRSRSHDLSVLVGSIDQALEVTTALPSAAKMLMERFWPGALTLVLPRDPDEEFDLGEDELTIGVRMPDHQVPLALCQEVGPLAATPAGVQGEAVFETAQQIADEFGAWVPLVLDAGRCVGEQATVVDATGEEPRLLRAGPISWAAIEGAL
ncbi:MAG: threonylcarbamoyl-AMP synthase [Actinobacteria bacterium]|nr:threonylcarbamoyl-AMP synthase [Actinomycetota bacterium]